MPDRPTPQTSPLDQARIAHRRANLYAKLGVTVCAGLAIALGLGFWNTPGPGFFSLGTAMVMIGVALTVISLGLVSALFAARSALVAVESYSELVGQRSIAHADELARAQAERDRAQDRAVVALTATEAQHDRAILAVQEAEKRDREALAQLKGREDRLEALLGDEGRRLGHEIANLRSRQSELTSRVTTDEHASAERMERLAARTDAAQSRTRRDLKEESERLHRAVSKVLAEERERKAEFEALAGEEIRLMGRVRRAEALAHGEPERAAEYYRISRPKATHRGPFGEVYPISEVEGLSAARAERLKEFGITNTEHLWRANPVFITALLRCEAGDVALWQEEAELMAINGIGRERAKVLVQAGVTSIEKLGAQEPERLVRLVARKGEANGAGAGVTEANAAKWIEAAHRMRT